MVKPNNLHAAGCVSKTSSPSGSMIQGCLLWVHTRLVGRSQDVSVVQSARTRGVLHPSACRKPRSHTPGETNRVFIRPLSAVRFICRGADPVRRKPCCRQRSPSRTRQALVVNTVTCVNQPRRFGDLVTDFAAKTATRFVGVLGLVLDQGRVLLYPLIAF
jgi:hypothetical protein